MYLHFALVRDENLPRMLLMHFKNLNRGAGTALCLAIAVTAFAQDKKHDDGRISLVLFSDAFSVLDHHDSDVNGMNGFWQRRMELTFERQLDTGITGLLRFDYFSPGDFSADGEFVREIMDAYVSHKSDRGTAYFGLTINPLIGSYESFHDGYRAIERIPIDLYKMSGSRDTGIGYKSSLGNKTKYWAMVGNDSGTASETNKGKAFYLNVNHEISPNLDLNATTVYVDKGGSDHWSTAALFLGYKGSKFEGSLFYGHQTRSLAASSNVSLDVVSMYIAVNASDSVKPFFRADFVNGPVPGADTISYLKMATTASPAVFIAGVDMKISQNVNLIPNLTWVSYSNPTAGPTPGSDLIFRLSVVSKF